MRPTVKEEGEGVLARRKEYLHAVFTPHVVKMLHPLPTLSELTTQAGQIWESYIVYIQGCDLKAKVLLTQNKQTKNKEIVVYETRVKRKQTIKKHCLCVTFDANLVMKLQCTSF